MFEKAVELSPKDEQLAGNLADAYRAGGRKDQATATYDKAIQLAFQQLQVNPKLASVTGDLALYYAKKGDVTNALQYARQARSLDPDDLQLTTEFDIDNVLFRSAILQVREPAGNVLLCAFFDLTEELFFVGNSRTHALHLPSLSGAFHIKIYVLLLIEARPSSGRTP